MGDKRLSICLNNFLCWNTKNHLQLLVSQDNEQEMEDGNIVHELTPEESRRFEDMEEDWETLINIY